MKITEINRSFSRTRQVKQFEPIQAFASYKMELSGEETPEEIKKISKQLHELAEEDVLDVINPQTSSSRRATTMQLVSRLKVLEEQVKRLEEEKKKAKPF